MTGRSRRYTRRDGHERWTRSAGCLASDLGSGCNNNNMLPPTNFLSCLVRHGSNMAKGANSDYHHTSPKGVSLFGGIHIRGHATGRRMAAGSPRSSCCYPPRPGGPPCSVSQSWANSGSCSGMFSGAYFTTARLINKVVVIPQRRWPVFAMEARTSPF